MLRLYNKMYLELSGVQKFTFHITNNIYYKAINISKSTSYLIYPMRLSVLLGIKILKVNVHEKKNN